MKRFEKVNKISMDFEQIAGCTEQAGQSLFLVK